MKFKSYITRIIELVRHRGLFEFSRVSINHCVFNFHVKKQLPVKCLTKPIHLQLEISRVCNLRCKMCEYAYQNNNGSLMSPEDFGIVLSRFPTVNSLDLTGIGEPFCNPDFISMVRIAKDRGLKVEFTTNGILMNEMHMDALIGAGVDIISFSVDASTRETHERVRTGSSFDNLLQNLGLLKEKISRLKVDKPKLHLSYTITKDNAAEAAHFPQLARRVGIDSIFYRDLLIFDSGYYSGRDRLDTFDSAFRQRLRERILHESGCLNIKVDLCESLIATGRIRKKFCYRPWRTCFVDVFGNLYPCCHLTQKNIDISRFSFGNILSQELKEIWNSSKYQSLRKGIVDPGHVPFLCQGCNCLIK